MEEGEEGKNWQDTSKDLGVDSCSIGVESPVVANPWEDGGFVQRENP